jgi:EAL and modified HD-GYP domain-containing signal transduction protein
VSADIFVARQPIFDRRKGVAAYELLFRAGLENVFPVGTDVDVASSRVINDTLLVFGFDALMTGKHAYVNVTRRVLVERLYALLPTTRTTIELLESIEPEPQVVRACKEVKAAGYTLALDDFVFRPEMEPLLRLADVIKVDWLATPPDVRKELPKKLSTYNVKLLAEKVESPTQFEQALSEGYSLFQGYFFSRPEIVSRKDVSTAKFVHLQFLRELQRPQLDFEKIEQVIKLDVALSVKLLRYLNSAAFGWRSRVTSLKQAIVMLGERPFRQWASLVAIVAIAAARPAELATLCLSRARFCELIGPEVGLAARQLDLFLTGLLSAIDALVGRPLDELLPELAIHKEVEQAIGGQRQTPLGQILALIIAYEHASWPDASRLAGALGLADEAVSKAYRGSLEWASKALAAQ